MGVASIDPVTPHSCGSVLAARIESPQLLRICTFGHLFGDVTGDCCDIQWEYDGKHGFKMVLWDINMVY